MKVIICGAGPVGALAALYAARAGHDVEIFEMRGDIAQEDHEASRQLGKSINITMSDRGFEALSQSGDPTLVEDIVRGTIPVFAREVHGANKNGDLTSAKIKYHVGGKALRVVSRGALRDILLNRVLSMPNVKAHFNRKLLHADLNAKVAVFADATLKDSYQAQPYFRVPFDLLIGADGAHSSVRYHLAKYENVDISQRWLDTWWCEFSIPRAKDGGARISLDTLHIWPVKDFMFLALPNPDGSFTCNLFAPGSIFQHLKHNANGNQIIDFFSHNFPGIVPSLINGQDLITQFSQSTPGPLHEMRVSRINYKNRCILVGDAAHTMVPFYGQGLNTGLEDVRVLFQDHLSQIRDETHLSKDGGLRDDVPLLGVYSDARQPDVEVMTSLALKNYNEMRTSRVSVWKNVRRSVEETLQAQCPGLGWCTLYARVAFSCQRFSSIQKDNDRQTIVLKVLVALLFLVTLFVSSWVMLLSFQVAAARWQ